jgi:hypothetical protein
MRVAESRNYSEGESMDVVSEGVGEASSPENTVIGDLGAARGDKLHEKLRGLLLLRAELDKDIEVLKGAVDILDKSSP